MQLSSYFEAFPEAEKYRGYIETHTSRHLPSGVFVFTSESSHNWSGPFPGHAAVWVIQRSVGCPPTSQVLMEVTNKLTHLAERGKLEYRAGFAADLLKIESGDHTLLHQYSGWGTLEYPFRIWVMGNDDTSYSKWFRSLEEAKDTVSLLEANEPLDFITDFLSLGWTFTN